jgi:hypothetical protein
MNQEHTLLAAIFFAQDQAVDHLMDYVARALVRQGYRVAGFIQYAHEIEGSCCGGVDVEDIQTGERFEIMQALGVHAKGCRLDPAAIAAVSVSARTALEMRPDILILNRFGKGETEGKGLRSAFEEAALFGIPVLTSVKEAYQPSWREFAGELSESLEQDSDKIMAWCLRAIEKTGVKIDAA